MAKSRNPVAKFSPRYNKSAVFKDRKREEKKTGYTKKRQNEYARCVWDLDSEA